MSGSQESERRRRPGDPGLHRGRRPRCGGHRPYVSYQHAFEVVRAHGESGLTARLEPATIDGLVYTFSGNGGFNRSPTKPS